MKKALIIPMLILAMSFSGCESSPNEIQTTLSEDNVVSANADGSKSANTLPSESADNQTPQEKTSKSVEEDASSTISVEETVLVEQDGVKVTLTSFADSSFMGPEFKLLIENDSLSFLSSQLELNGIDVIKDIELKFKVFNDETWDDIFDTETVYIQTSADPAYTQAYDESGALVLEQNGIKIVAKTLESEESFWGADLYLYIANDSNQDIMVQVRDVSINGFMVTPMFSCNVINGKKAIDSISFLESELDENGITTIENMELSFNISNMQTWETLFETEPIAITF